MIRVVDPAAHPRIPAEVDGRLIAAVTPRTRLALISHVTSPSGLVLPIEDIVRELDRLGVDTLVDAAHAPGMVPLDVSALGRGLLDGNGHKWLCGPKVSGLLVRRDPTVATRSDRRSRATARTTGEPTGPRLWRDFDWQGTTDPTPFLALPDRDPDASAPSSPTAGRPHGREPRAAIRTRRRLLEILGGEPIAPESMLGSMASVVMPPGASATDREASALTGTAWPSRTASRCRSVPSPFPRPEPMRPTSP